MQESNPFDYSEQRKKSWYSDQDIINYCYNRKRMYESQRDPWVTKWRETIRVFNNDTNQEKVYHGRSQISIPIADWKVRGITARENKIIFNVQPMARLEPTKQDNKEKTPADLWNKYIFEKQLIDIDFEKNYKTFSLLGNIQGTSVAKITQEYEVKNFSYFDDQEEEEIIVKDNTYFRPLLLEEFYSDVTKEDINDSELCIHSSVIPIENLYANEKRTENGKTVGLYENLDLLTGNGDGISAEQQEYFNILGLNANQAMSFRSDLKETSKSGFVKIDEFWGLYDFDSEGTRKECLIVVANDTVVIRKQYSPYRHKRYVRPFIVGRDIKLPNCLYGHSKLMKSIPLIQELNASRAQTTDSRTRRVSPMWVKDSTSRMVWDGIWKPGGVISTDNMNSLQALAQPDLTDVSIEDAMLIQRDIDQVFNLSPVQEGTSDSRMVPKTASQTRDIISQNDMPLNDKIRQKTIEEIIPFITMLYERDLQFKTVEDLLSVWEEKDLVSNEYYGEMIKELQGMGIQDKSQLKIESGRLNSLIFDFSVKVLGNLELSNEVAHQIGLTSFIQLSLQIPPIAKRLNWIEIGNELLKTYGINDISDNIYLPEEIVLKADQEAAKQQEIENGLKLQSAKTAQLEDYEAKKYIDTQADITKMTGEAMIQMKTNENVRGAG